MIQSSIQFSLGQVEESLNSTNDQPNNPNKKKPKHKKRRLRMVWTPQTTETALAIVNKNSHVIFRGTEKQQIRTYTSDPKCSSSIVSQHFCSMSAQTFCNLGPGTLSDDWIIWCDRKSPSLGDRSESIP